MIRILFIVAFLISLSGIAQKPEDNVNLKKFNVQFLEQLLEKKVNENRQSKNCNTLNPDKILKLAAEDQSKHILSSGKVEHEQPNKKKATPLDRVQLFDGLHSEIGENCIQVVLGSKVKKAGTNTRVTLKSYEDVANAIVDAWAGAKESPSVLFNRNYYNIGTSVVFEAKSKKIIATQVYGSEPFILPEGVKQVKDDYRIEPYNKEKCLEIDKNFPYLPELLSDNIYFKNGQLYFYFHDLELLKSVLSSNNDAIAIDIISRSQFSCKTGNRIYPSKIHTGVLLPPVNKNYIFSKNELKDAGQVEVSLGVIPSYVDTTNMEFTLLIIKNNCLCQTIVYNSLLGENLTTMDLTLAMDTLSVSNKADSVTTVLNFTVPFQKGKFDYKIEDIEPFLDSISLNRYDLKRIDIIAFSSLEGNEKENKMLQERRAQSILKAIKNYKLQEVPTSVKTEENLQGFFESIKGSPYEKEFTGLSKEAILKIVNSDTLNYNLEPYLEDQRKAEIKLTVEKIFMDSSVSKDYPIKFKSALKTKDYTKAKSFQSLAFNAVGEGDINVDELLKIAVPHFKETVPINNNQIALRWFYEKNTNKDSLNHALLKEIQVQLNIQPLNAFLNYNKLALQLMIWSENLTSQVDLKNLMKEIKMLYGSEIEPFKIHQMMLNFHLISAEYYYETKKFKERDKALLEVKKLLLQSQLNKQQIERISEYFIFQMRISWAVELMKPLIDKKLYDEDFLFTYLTIAIYDNKIVPETEYNELLKVAAKMNNQRFCKLFGYPNMSFQLLKNYSVKQIYCEACNY